MTASRTKLQGLDGRDVVGRFDILDAGGVLLAKWSIGPGFWVV